MGEMRDHNLSAMAKKKMKNRAKELFNIFTETKEALKNNENKNLLKLKNLNDN